MKLTDGYGEALDRTYNCRDDAASVVVQITDTCELNEERESVCVWLACRTLRDMCWRRFFSS